MRDPLSYADDLGPEKIIHVYEPETGLKGILVVDNTAAGPAIGGLRMAPDVSLDECFRLARAMTLKNAAAGLPHGGGKSVIFASPHMAETDKEHLIRAFAAALSNIQSYIFGPDMGTNETCMAWVKNEIGRAVGLPREIGGIPLDEIGATGFGVSVAADVAKDFCGLDMEGARVAVQGFGSVGIHAARFLAERGALLVGVSDSNGTLANPDGLDVASLIVFKQAGNAVSEFGAGESLSGEAIVGIECDIWIPAARPDVLTVDNVNQLNTRMVIQGANIPATAEAELCLHERGIICVPDFIANAGGVICGAVEYAGGSQSSALTAIEEKVRANTKTILDSATKEGITPRAAATALAHSRVRRAMEFRRKY